MVTSTGVMRYLIASIPVALIYICLPIAKEKPPKYDVLLISYSDFDFPTETKQSEIAKKFYKMGIERVITYPDTFIPVLIQKENLSRVKRLLGDDAVLQLSPKLE